MLVDFLIWLVFMMDFWLCIDDVIFVINCGGLLIENELYGICFKRDEYFIGGDVLRIEEEVMGVYDVSLY